jgi:dUTP pyrophosphatase
MSLEFKFLNENARLPMRATPDDAGLDLYAADAFVIPVGGRRLVPTGLSVNIPRGYYGRIAPRSGLAWKDGIDVAAGVIDVGYRGELKVLLVNNGKVDFCVTMGLRVAQLIVEACAILKPVAVMSFTGASADRGGGFGSTGLL